jgi:hypothetical protein
MTVKKRKMTKRQLLNALLENEEKKIKLKESRKRLYARETKLKDERDELEKNLKEIILMEQEKNGGSEYYVEGPIVFKGNAFTYKEEDRWSSSSEYVEITTANLL